MYLILEAIHTQQFKIWNENTYTHTYEKKRQGDKYLNTD